MARWGKVGLVLCAMGAWAGLSTHVQANIIQFDVIPAFAPQGPISPSWNGYVANAITGIAGNTDVGDRSTDPAAYERLSGPIPPHEMIYTPFNSWRGLASPNPAFAALPAPFQAEFGNRVHFGVHIVSTGETEFALSDLTWQLDSNDTTDFFDQSGNFAGANYSATRVGIHYGADGVPGGGDDAIFNNGQAGSNPIHELIYVGVGDGFLSDNPSALSDQADIDLTLANIFSGCDEGVCVVDLTATYALPDPQTGGEVSGSGTAQILVPEPSTLTLLLGGLMCAVLAARRR